MWSRLLPTEKSDPELYPLRAGLVFGFFNSLTWQVGIGTPMVLFAESLGANPFQVGLAYSFIFLLTPIQILSTALIPRYGFRRVMLSGWGTRSIFLAVPLGLAVLAPGGTAPWMVHALVGSVFFFCLCRSIGAASFVPWMYVLLPENARGRYFASDQFLSGIGGVATLITCALLFLWVPLYTALLIQYGVAVAGSTFSYFALTRLPDAEKPSAISLKSVFQDTPKHMLKASPYRTYLWLAVLFAVISAPVPPFAAYYLKVVPQLDRGHIMWFEVARFLGVIAAAWYMKSRVDRAGAKPFLLMAAALYAAVAVYWIFFLDSHAGGMVGLFLVYPLVGVGAAAWSAANLNFLPKVTSSEHRTLMVSVHGAVTACVGGLSPVIWGLFLEPEGGERGIDAFVFQLFFWSVLAICVLLLWLIARLPEDNTQPVEPLFVGSAILRPLRSVTFLVNLLELPKRPAKAPPTPPPPQDTDRPSR